MLLIVGKFCKSLWCLRTTIEKNANDSVAYFAATSFKADQILRILDLPVNADSAIICFSTIAILLCKASIP